MQAHVVAFFALNLVLVAMLALGIAVFVAMAREAHEENLEWRRWCAANDMPVEPTIGEQVRHAIARVHNLCMLVAETAMPKLKELQAGFISLML